MTTVYSEPTFKAYDDPEEQWREWKRQANKLPREDVRRHASVSTSNRHACRNCFCCACVEYLREVGA
jgi:hypothetical protein